MLAISPKGTVPVLQCIDGTVIEESLDIMLWALQQQDLQGLLDAKVLQQAKALINQNDNQFKPWLDRYKYADRHPEMTQLDYPNLQQWLKSWLEHPLFLLAMTKFLPWQAGDSSVTFSLSK